MPHARGRAHAHCLHACTTLFARTHHTRLTHLCHARLVAWPHCARFRVHTRGFAPPHTLHYDTPAGFYTHLLPRTLPTHLPYTTRMHTRLRFASTCIHTTPHYLHLPRTAHTTGYRTPPRRPACLFFHCTCLPPCLARLYACGALLALRTPHALAHASRHLPLPVGAMPLTRCASRIFVLPRVPPRACASARASFLHAARTRTHLCYPALHHTARAHTLVYAHPAAPLPCARLRARTTTTPRTPHARAPHAHTFTSARRSTCAYYPPAHYAPALPAVPCIPLLPLPPMRCLLLPHGFLRTPAFAAAPLRTVLAAFRLRAHTFAHGFHDCAARAVRTLLHTAPPAARVCCTLHARAAHRTHTPPRRAATRTPAALWDAALPACLRTHLRAHAHVYTRTTLVCTHTTHTHTLHYRQGRTFSTYLPVTSPHHPHGHTCRCRCAPVRLPLSIRAQPSPSCQTPAPGRVDG